MSAISLGLAAANGLIIPAVPTPNVSPAPQQIAAVQSLRGPLVNQRASEVAIFPTTDVLAAKVFGLGQDFSGYKSRDYDDLRASPPAPPPPPAVELKSEYDSIPKVGS